MSPAPEAHICNPSYSGSGLRFKASLGNSSERPYLKKNPSQKRAGGVARSVGPEFKPSTTKKKKKNGDSYLLQMLD
jgi:hypothetical protein